MQEERVLPRAAEQKPNAYSVAVVAADVFVAAALQ